MFEATKMETNMGDLEEVREPKSGWIMDKTRVSRKRTREVDQNEKALEERLKRGSSCARES